jgi:DNA-binding response OmpR family regulator
MSRILLIEDDRTVRESLHRGLTILGHQVFAAENGADGLTLFQTHPVELVVTDIVMPNVEGVETIRTLRTLNPTMPIIAMSGGHGYLEDVRHFGATETFEKPFELTALEATIRKLLGTSPEVAGVETAPSPG